MTDVPDARLLDQFARNGSEEAFAALVQRHIALVHSVALRHTANAQHAEDITQAVFVILARKAGALGRKTVLPGWLYHTARLTAANLQRAETRRVHREQEAFMQSKLEESPTDALWRELSPQLDEAMADLGTAERDALVLRYFQNKSMAEVAKFLGLEENTAQKRVSRALEKLRKFFTKRGTDSTTTAIAENISAHSVQAVPVALAKAVTTVAIAKGATASISTLTLIKGALKIMAWTKAKTAVVAAAVVLVVAGTTTVVVKKISSPSVDESLWSVNSDNFLKAPPVLIIRPARDPNRSGSVDAGDKIIGLNMPISALFTRAYGPGLGVARMIFPPEVARQHYDLMLTLPDHESESLRDKLKTQLGLVARREIVETNVLCLKVKDAAMLGSRISKGGSSVDYMTSDISSAKIVITNQPISTLTAQLESLLQIPTVDQTGLNENFDLNLKWNRIDPRHDSLKNALLDQLGLELAPVLRKLARSSRDWRLHGSNSEPQQPTCSSRRLVSSKSDEDGSRAKAEGGSDFFLFALQFEPRYLGCYGAQNNLSPFAVAVRLLVGTMNRNSASAMPGARMPTRLFAQLRHREN